MDFSLSEEQELLQETVRGFVAKECPPQTVRAIFDGERQAVPALWKGLAEIGVAGLAVPEAHGGAGLELLELALVAEELGRGAVPVPFLGHALATLALARGGSEAQQAAWLPRLAAGERARHGRARRGRRDAGCPPSGASSSRTVACAAASSSCPRRTARICSWSAAAAATLALVEARRRRARRRAEPTLDRSRPLATLALDGRAGRGARRRPTPRACVDAALVLLAADAFGAAHQLVRATVAYVKTRQQFGQPIAQFQAVKHQLANMALEVDPTRGLWWYAAHAFDHVPARGAARARRSRRRTSPIARSRSRATRSRRTAASASPGSATSRSGSSA